MINRSIVIYITIERQRTFFFFFFFSVVFECQKKKKINSIKRSITIVRTPVTFLKTNFHLKVIQNGLRSPPFGDINSVDRPRYARARRKKTNNCIFTAIGRPSNVKIITVGSVRANHFFIIHADKKKFDGSYSKSAKSWHLVGRARYFNDFSARTRLR